MKITSIEVVKSRKPVPLAETWRPAWNEPDTSGSNAFGFGFYKVHTDEGIVGIGPYTGDVSPMAVNTLIGQDPMAVNTLIGQDPAYIQRFWEVNMRGRGVLLRGASCGGLEIALWDIVGKAAGMPVYKMLGAYRDKVMAYAATGQLKSAEHYAAMVLQFKVRGIKAVKLRMHRPDPEEDLDFVRAVRDAVGDDMTIMVDANQNNPSIQYRYWSRRTAMRVARELDDLDVYWLEEPLPRTDLEGLSELCDAVDMYIAGAEHCTNLYEFRDALFAGAYDIVQPDVILGHIGISGIRKIAVLADAVGRLVVPHVCGGGNNGILLAATLQALGTIGNCPFVEYPLDPPSLTPEMLQLVLKEPLLIDEQGYVSVPDKPGIGIEIDEEAIAEYL
jgi:L-alanine-DL-glutamate epimerase-like enolase superfamily enzyme